MKKKMKERLEEHCRETMADGKANKSQLQDWAFGAIRFAFKEKMISFDDYKELTDRFCFERGVDRA